MRSYKKYHFNFNILKDISTQIYSSTTKNKKEFSNDILRNTNFHKILREEILYNMEVIYYMHHLAGGQFWRNSFSKNTKVFIVILICSCHVLLW